LYGAIKGLNLTDDSLNINVAKGEEGKFDYVVVAVLDNNVSHVDNALFIFEVTKEGGGITEGDFEITAISLRDDTEGINDTFEIVNGKLKATGDRLKDSSSQIRQQPPLQLSSKKKEPIQ
jgi:hypothetical protein